MSSAAKTELGNERCLKPWPILPKQDGKNVQSLPTEAHSSHFYHTVCSAELCPALLTRAGVAAWPCSGWRWLKPHTEPGWKAPAEVPMLLAPHSSLFSGSWIALQKPSKAPYPAFPLTKQVGLSGVSSVKSTALCFHGDACFSINWSPFIVASFPWWEKLEIEQVPPDHFYTIQVRLRAKSRQNNRQKTIFSLQWDPSCST